MLKVSRFVPLVGQLKKYSKQDFNGDLVAACVVTIMLIPQSLAYALLAGVPAEVGLYASILPILGYAIFGSCKTLAVGPVAIASLMTASALGEIGQQGQISYLEGAMLLALLSGLFLLLMGLLRLGFLSHFLSHSVVTGFITASGLVIALSQLKHILGIDAQGHNFIEIGQSLIINFDGLNKITLILGSGALAFLFWARRGVSSQLVKYGMQQNTADIATKVAPIIGVFVTTLLVFFLELDDRGVSIVGEIPIGLPHFDLINIPLSTFKLLLFPAILISIIGYVESISVGKTLSGKRREKIDGNQELIGLGVANIASSISGAFPVSGGFARSVVNFDAGARTQLAGIFTAIGISMAALTLTPLLYYLPKAMLAATIIVAVLALIDLSIFKSTWDYSKSDFMAVLLTVIVTLLNGVELGVACGIVTSIFLHLYYTSKPHIAEVGLMPGTEHFRNIHHYDVETSPSIVTLRIDESLLFSNVGYLEEYVDNLISERVELKHVVLQCGAINGVDYSALEMLEKLNETLLDLGIKLHLSEVKVPIQKLLIKSGFFDHLSGSVYLSQIEAYRALLEESLPLDCFNEEVMMKIISSENKTKNLES